jgi:hypothetical protein
MNQRLNAMFDKKDDNIKNNLQSPIYKNSSSSIFIERNFSLNNRIEYANNFIKHFSLKSIANFIIIKKDNYIYKNLHLNKRIGSESNYGAIYEVSYGVKPKLYIIAAKLICINTSNNKEIRILKKVTKVLLEKKTIHFPIMYFTSKIEKTPIMINSLLPSALAPCNNFHIVFNEMFSGDLKMLMKSKKHSLTFVRNTITQIFFSISNFSYYTGALHNDAHWGNFLYHKIKPGGFFYYKINDVDVYLENIGYIWVIWDYGFAKKITSENVHKDYSRIIHAFYPYLYNGWIPDKIHKDVKQDKGIDFGLKVSKEIKNISYYDESIEYKKYLIHKILLDLYPELLLKPNESLIINKEPYIIQ